MAGIAFRASRNVVPGFSWLCDPIVTARTATEHLFTMDKGDDIPGIGRGMTDFTGFAGDQVPNVLTRGADAIMAGFAIAPDPDM